MVKGIVIETKSLSSQEGRGRIIEGFSETRERPVYSWYLKRWGILRQMKTGGRIVGGKVK